jgi:hypothetical protein
VRHGTRVHAISIEQRVLRARDAMQVELLLEQRIDGRVEIERESRWAVDAEA